MWLLSGSLVALAGCGGQSAAPAGPSNDAGSGLQANIGPIDVPAIVVL